MPMPISHFTNSAAIYPSLAAAGREMLVPYQPSVAPAHRTRGGFADYLRRGGRVNPIPFGSAPRDDERLPLMSEESETVKLIRMSERSNRMTRWAILVTLLISCIVFGLLIGLLSQANNSVTALRAVIDPHAASVVNATVDMLHDMGGSMYNIKQITRMTNSLAQAELGPSGSAGQALNSTARIAERLAEFMTHPTIQVSLGR